jgi:chemotaxis protein methyltransferase CheR
MIEESNWIKILFIFDQLTLANKILTPFMLKAKAMALANLGHLQESIEVIKKNLTNNSTDKHSYFLFALTLIELNQPYEAEIALRNALFLDREFVMCHYQLGLLLIRNNQRGAGIKCLKNALNIAKSKVPNQHVIDSKGLTYGRLTEILKNELDLYNLEMKQHG